MPAITHADEGMWIPLLLEKYNEEEMRDMGMKLSAEDIYSINHTSLKDGIVIFGGGCTAELVSDQGLLLTNHHCGYGQIQRHSSLENDYLTDGFWGMDRSEELQNPGLSVTFLISMQDVTGKVLQDVGSNMTEKIRDSIIDSRIEEVVNSITDTSEFLSARIKPFYHGNQYLLFINKVYKDVRLVGAPPSNIGKFGGDTDNWMWPRHTGDFSLFRVYADSNNNPAEYSPDNIPYKPKYYFPISLKGYEPDDFTLVFGYPGSTQQYIPSDAVELLTRMKNPVRIKLRGLKLDVMKRYMEQDDLIRLQYAAKVARVANGWKKWIGENKGIQRLNTIERKKEKEKNFQQWADADPERRKKYGGILAEFSEVYDQLEPLELSRTYLIEGGLGVELLRYAGSFRELVDVSNNDPEKEQVEELTDKFIKRAKNHFKNYQVEIDKEIFVKMIREYYQEIPEEDQPEIFETLRKKYDGNVQEYANDIYDKSFMTSEEDVVDFLDKYKARKYKKIKKDPAFELVTGLYDKYYNDIQPQISDLDAQKDSLQRIYMRAQMTFEPERRFYPDANFTLRVAYGNIGDYYPRDAVRYDYYTTLQGIMEKEDPEVYDYVVEEKLKELYREKDFGRYVDKDGTLHVCFIADNHTSGGNSGSPVINAEGELIGINFDRCWEGTMSDIVFDPDRCRNISLDIRYCLFIIDKFAGATHLVEEMDLVTE
ncbi:MAG: S46 family peptidase [Bacteroidales bacterium]